MSTRKRQRADVDSEATIVPSSGEPQNHPPKKARKETNASARRSLFVRSLPAIATSEALTELFSENYPLKHATVVLTLQPNSQRAMDSLPSQMQKTPSVLWMNLTGKTSWGVG